MWSAWPAASTNSPHCTPTARPCGPLHHAGLLAAALLPAQLNQVGYWNDIPASPDAPVIVVNSTLQEQLDPLLRERYHTQFYGLRPGVLLVLNVRQDLWDRYFLTK